MGYHRNTNVEWLLSHSYGQGGSVAVPSGNISSEIEQRGDFPAGVQDILNRLADQYIDWPPKDSRNPAIEWCFLVGGPGNGKTKALQVLAGLLDVKLPQRSRGEPAPRVVPSNWPLSACPVPTVSGIEVAFLNDASIPREDITSSSGPGSLFLDLVDGMNWLLSRDTSVVLFGNINRGILVEEEAALHSNHPSLESDIGSLARDAIQWLLHPPDKVFPSSTSKVQTVIPLDFKKPYYCQFQIPLIKFGAKYDITVHVIFLDTLSLLEPLPGGGASNAIDFSTTVPRVVEYRTFGGFSDERGASRNQTVAGGFLGQLVMIEHWEEGGCKDSQKVLCPAYNACPFAQNAKWLRSHSLQNRFLDVLRAVEIAASRRLTYRDIVGHFSLSILGQLETSWMQEVHPCEWVQQKVMTIMEDHSKAAAAQLVLHRLYTNIFPSPEKEAWRKAKVRAKEETVYSVAIRGILGDDDILRNRAFEHAFNDIDPARDVDPWKDGNREKVLEAVETLEIDPPSNQLVNDGILPSEANSEIESILDQVIREEIAAELSESSKSTSGSRSDAAQRARLLRKWRNTLLLRQVGLATGQFTFKNVLGVWLSEQYNALKGDAPLELAKGVSVLLLPENRDARLLLAPFRPRIYGLAEDELPPNTILVSINQANLKVEIVPKGDLLTADVLQSSRGTREPPVVIASVVIDLSIAREAILRIRSESSSFTEIGVSAFARIERVRASLVGRNAIKQATVFFTDELGKLYQLTNNPAGPAALRVLSLESQNG